MCTKDIKCRRRLILQNELVFNREAQNTLSFVIVVGLYT